MVVAEQMEQAVDERPPPVVAHDLRAPLRGLDGFSQILMEDYQGKLDADAHDHLRRIRAASHKAALMSATATAAPQARGEE